MAINTLGLTQGLAAAGQDYNSSYLNAYGTVYSRNLAQQKQTSESNLQNSQADYYSGRNSSALQVADARRQGMIDAYKIRAQGQTDAATINNMKYLPKFEQDTAGQTPEVAAQNAGIFDQKFGTNLRSLFAPSDPSLSGSGVSPTLPPLGGLTAPSISFSAPSVGLSGLGRNTMPPPQITGVSPALLPPSGPIGNMPTPAAPTASPGGFGGSLSGLSSAGGMTLSGMSPALPPPSGPIGSQPPASANSGATMPSLPPSGPLGNPALSGPIGAGMPQKNPFSPSPLTVSQINKNNAGANGALSKTDMAFQNSVGLLPPTQQAQATARFNQINGTNYAVPGTKSFPSLADGTPTLGPPSVAQPYTPNALQTSIIGRNGAQAGLDNSLGAAATVGGQVKQMTAHQQAAYQNSLIALKRQGLTDDEARARTDEMYKLGMLGVAKENAGTAQSRLQQSGGNGVAGDGLTLRMNQRLTALTMPGKLDLMGHPTSPPLVTLDAQGNPTGPGAAEYRSIQGMMRSRAGGTVPANPVGGGYHLIPGVGSQVRGISGPTVPSLPNFPGAGKGVGQGTGQGDLLTINGRTATRAQWAAEMAKPGRR